MQPCGGALPGAADGTRASGELNLEELVASLAIYARNRFGLDLRERLAGIPAVGSAGRTASPRWSDPQIVQRRLKRGPRLGHPEPKPQHEGVSGGMRKGNRRSAGPMRAPERQAVRGLFGTVLPFESFNRGPVDDAFHRQALICLDLAGKQRTHCQAS